MMWFWTFVDWWIMRWEDLSDWVLDTWDKLTTTKNILWYHKKFMRKLKRRLWIKKWFGRFNGFLWLIAFFYVVQTVLSALEGAWAWVVASSVYVAVFVIWAYRRGQATYQNMIASAQAMLGGSGTTMTTTNAIVQGQPPMTAAQAKAIARSRLQAAGGPPYYNVAYVGGKKTGKKYQFPPSGPPWSPSAFLQYMKQGGGSNLAKSSFRGSSSPLTDAQRKALLDAMTKATEELARRSTAAFEVLDRAMKSFAGTWEEAMLMALAMCSEMGIRIEPPELEAPTGVDIAGYVYGIRAWTATSMVDEVTWDQIDFTTKNVHADEWLQKWNEGKRKWVVSPLNGGDPWVRGENIAVCTQQKDHAVTNPRCGCGFWAFWTIEALDEAFNMYEGFVAGIIRGYGNVLEASLGFRTEKAEIIGFLVNEEHRDTWPALQELAIRYQVAVYRYGMAMSRDLADMKYSEFAKEFEQNWDEGLHTTVPGKNPFNVVYVPPGVDPIPIPQPSTWRPA